MTRKELIDNGYEHIVVFDSPDDFDGCILGVSTDRQAVYSLKQMVEWFSKKENCDESEALEFIEYNTLRALPYYKLSPIVMNDL